MATQLIQCRRVVTYLPSVRTAVIRARAFSSQHNRDNTELPPFDASEDSSVKTVWPDHALGPLGPQDKRFPLPGRIGPYVASHTLVAPAPAANNQAFLDYLEVENKLPSAAEQRHEDICEQFLSSVDEIELDFIDQRTESMGSESAHTDRMEIRAHSCPHILRKDFKDLFPNRDITEGNLTVVVISLKADHDMTTWSDKVEEEREQLMETFIQGSVEICQAFEDAGFWADFIDPSSGKPFKGPHTNTCLWETDERYRKLGFDIRDLGCCKVISHPVWGSRAFIGSLFTDAPISHPLVTGLNAQN